MGYCECPKPTESPDSRKAGSCTKCGHLIGPGEVISDDATLNAFLRRLGDAFPGKPTTPFDHFRDLVASRERAGRTEFGLSYLARRNCAEAVEEALDLVVYMHLDLLKARRDGDEEDWSTALSAAYHAFLAYQFAQQREAKRRGSP